MPDRPAGKPGMLDAVTRVPAKPVPVLRPTHGSRSARIDPFEVTFDVKSRQIEPTQFNIPVGTTDLIFLLKTVGGTGDERAKFGKPALEWRDEESASRVFGPPQVVGESRLLCTLRNDNANRGSDGVRFEFNFVIVHGGRIHRPASAIVDDPPVRSSGVWGRLFSWLRPGVETRLPA